MCLLLNRFTTLIQRCQLKRKLINQIDEKRDCLYLLIRDISQFRGHLMNPTPYQVLLNFTGGDGKLMMPAYLRSERGDEKWLG